MPRSLRMAGEPPAEGDGAVAAQGEESGRAADCLRTLALSGFAPLDAHGDGADAARERH